MARKSLKLEALAVTSFETESVFAEPTIGTIGDLRCCTGCVSGCGINPTAGGCASGGGSILAY